MHLNVADVQGPVACHTGVGKGVSGQLVAGNAGIKNRLICLGAKGANGLGSYRCCGNERPASGCTCNPHLLSCLKDLSTGSASGDDGIHGTRGTEAENGERATLARVDVQRNGLAHPERRLRGA